MSWLYQETCLRHLSRNWRYGRPLVDDALNRKKFQDAERWRKKHNHRRNLWRDMKAVGWSV
jgi:hypothetical protein